MSDQVSVQINVAPTDLPHAREILPHQLRQFAAQVDEVVLTVDTQPGGGRFATRWASRETGLQDLLAQLVDLYPGVRVEPVDYSEAAAEEVAGMFFDRATIPPKDFRGGPFYCYFYGLLAARHDWVLHLDCDMMFGGGSQRWVAEALQILRQRPEVLACNPLPGPPTRDGTLNARHYHTQDSEPEPGIPNAFRFHRLSTRMFLLDRRRLAALGGPGFASQITEQSPAPMPEGMISLAMQRAGLVRIDFLGTAPGMWAVHPWARDDDFYRQLPALIERIERGEVSDDQRGTQELSLGMLQRRRGFRFYRHLPGYRRLPWLR